jgi:hypothetical protein
MSPASISPTARCPSMPIFASCEKPELTSGSGDCQTEAKLESHGSVYRTVLPTIFSTSATQKPHVFVTSSEQTIVFEYLA